MKKIIVCIIIIIGTCVQAQTIEYQVIGSSGTTLSNASASINFTVGELVVTTITDGTTTLTQGFHQGEIQLSINLSAVAYLQGAALNPNTGEETLMRDDLRVADYIPTTSPYSDNATCNAAVFTTTGVNAIVDWIWVELRDETTNTIVLHSQSALLQRDGDVVAIDGTSTLSINAGAGNYYVAINHRNHLGMMSANTITLSATATIVNFTDNTNQITYGTNAQSTYGMPSGKVGMWTGNVGGDASVRYQGSGNDTNNIKDNVLADAGNTTSSNLHTFTGYDVADVNLDGSIRYQGSGNDTNSIKDAVLAHPDNQSSPSNLFIILEQLPEN
ncbi:MAG: hemagglutinin protein [Kordia sp.]|nr:MAG: hemagglutinin protein [Kordia sp.]